ncbi:MAG TPA: heparan-alpha-glucosaminide N-acetyltransferase domain-containing protein [Anaerolineales bacterium]
MSGTTQIRGEKMAQISTIPFAARLGGVVGLLTVILAILISILTSNMDPSLARTISVIPTVGVVIWLVGVNAFQSPHLGRLGSAGAIATVVGLTALVTLQLVQVIAQRAPLGMANRFIESPILPPLFGLTVLLVVWGSLALGVVSLQIGLFPRSATTLWMVGLMMLLVTSWQLVGLVTSAGILWTSIIMLRRAPTSQTTPPRDLSPASPYDATTSTKRLFPLDALRGTIMILMAIDHASYFVRRWHPFETWDQPLPAYPSLAAMLTRLATHPCAPGFYFLMGAGMVLFAQARRKSGWSERRIAGHLALRGLLLILLEKFIVDLATSNQPNLLEFSILAGLGVAMLMGILFLRLSGPMQAAIGAAVILVMQILPEILLRTDLGVFTPIRLLLLPGSVGSAFVLYPPIPWLGVALLGMGFARFITRDPERAYRLALIAGLTCLVLFPIVRVLGGFGNLRMPNGNTLIDFLNVVKYPPSLSFLLLSLGFDLVALALFARVSRWLAFWGQPLVIFGRSALYFFMAHWFIYGAFGMGFPTPGGLPETYLVWVIGLIALYPICKAYEAFKHHTPVSSVWRMI